MNKLLIVLLFGLHGAVAWAQQVPVPPSSRSTLAPGLYVQVIDGAINLSNKVGSQRFSAGQFGYTSSLITPPVVVPKNPGLQFTPPPAFNVSGTTNTASTTKANAVDCEVR